MPTAGHGLWGLVGLFLVGECQSSGWASGRTLPGSGSFPKRATLHSCPVAVLCWAVVWEPLGFPGCPATLFSLGISSSCCLVPETPTSWEGFASASEPMVRGSGCGQRTREAQACALESRDPHSTLFANGALLASTPLAPKGHSLDPGGGCSPLCSLNYLLTQGVFPFCCCAQSWSSKICSSLLGPFDGTHPDGAHAGVFFGSLCVSCISRTHLPDGQKNPQAL